MKSSTRLMFGGLLMGCAPLSAQSVSIQNPGFESPPIADGQFQAGAISGWTAFNGAATALLNPAVGDLSSEAPEGQNVAILIGTDAEIGLAQVLTSNFLAGASYTLTAKVANTLFTNGFPGYRVQLLAGSTVIAEDDNSQPIAEDSVVTATVNYTYNAADAALAGQPLSIRLLAKGLGATNEIAFDDVKLTVALADPVAIPGGPYAVFVGGSLLLNGGGSLPSNGATLSTYEWDLDDDGDYDEGITGVTPSAIPDTTLVATYGMELGSNPIKLRVTDSTGKNSIAATSVNILPATAVVYEPFAYTGTALNGQSGTSEVGLTGLWNANASSFLGPNRSFGALVTRGAGIGNLQGGINRFGGARAVDATALSGNGLLQDGATLWFSVIMGYDTGGNVSNSRIAMALANSNFNTGNNQYNVPDASGQTGSGMGVTLGGSGVGNFRIGASRFLNSGTPTFGTLSPATYPAAGQAGLVVGKFTWGATSDTLELYLPGPDLVLPDSPVSTLTVNVNQSEYDTVTWSRGDRVFMDEIRFGASYSAVIESGSAWDLNGANAGVGSESPSGIWNAGTSSWNVAPDGTLAPVPWTPGGVATFSAGNDATGAYTVTVDGTQDISGIVFEDGTTTVTGGTALRLTGNATITVADSLTATINTPLSENAAGREMSKGGNGLLVLTGNNAALTGSTSINGGAIRFDAPVAIPGTERSLVINANGTAVFGPSFGEATIATALANRIAAASTGTIAADNYATANFDFSTAGLTGASLGAVGAVDYTGTLTPNGTTYRLGGGGGTLTLAAANAVTGENGLVVAGAGTVVLAAANDFTGPTTVNNGAILRILGPTATSSVTVNQISSVIEVGHNDALGTGTLTFGGGFGASPSIRAIGNVALANPVNMAGNFNIEGTGTLSFGTITTSAGNPPVVNNVNTANPTTIAAITAAGAARPISFSGNGSTAVTGVIGGGSGVTNLIKGGNGTLTLSGENNYTGTTTVNDGGTLLVASPGSLPAGAVTMNGTSTLTGDGTIGGAVTVTAAASIAPGNNGVGTLPIVGNLTVSAMAGSTGTLRYQLGSIAASDRITVGGTLALGTDVFGFNDFQFTALPGLQNGTYKLITASAITGTLQSTNVTGAVGTGTGTLQINGNDIELVVEGVSAAAGYAAWSGGAPADADTNADGVKNGVAWALGATTPNTNAIALLPTIDNISDPAYTLFRFDRSDEANADPQTAISVEYGSDLVGWTPAVDNGDSVIIQVIDGSPKDQVLVKLKRSTLAPATGRLFARLKVVVTP